jgi:hypothetical protein
MNALKSSVNSRSEDFRANLSAMRELVSELRVHFAAVSSGGGLEAQAKHTARGKLLPRDRVNRLLDAGTPFLEIGQLAANGMYDDQAPSAGIIAGIGRVESVECMIIAYDATVKGAAERRGESGKSFGPGRRRFGGGRARRSASPTPDRNRWGNPATPLTELAVATRAREAGRRDADRPARPAWAAQRLQAAR